MNLWREGIAVVVETDAEKGLLRCFFLSATSFTLLLALCYFFECDDIPRTTIGYVIVQLILALFLTLIQSLTAVSIFIITIIMDYDLEARPSINGNGPFPFQEDKKH